MQKLQEKQNRKKEKKQKILITDYQRRSRLRKSQTGSRAPGKHCTGSDGEDKRTEFSRRSPEVNGKMPL